MPATDLELLIQAAHASGNIATRFWTDGHKTWDKPGDAGPVTEADLAVDAMLHDTLRAARPNYGWLSEETEDNTKRLTQDTIFIIDPIDGTRAFAAGERTWAHSLAVAHRGQITAAVVYLPLRDKIYTAATGQGAQANGAPIQPSPRTALDGAQILASKPTFQPQHWIPPMPKLNRNFRTSIAYRMCLVAEGRFDAMFTFRNTWEWDIAAGALIAAEAGATVTDRHGTPITFNSPDAHAKGTLCAPAPIHAQTLAALTTETSTQP
ncbi:3'(2'),5'-bisphosphate nucleotidase CysQ [Actibacterium sp. 188UL27-1]|uniref:3'(2'),5'-bisphosphate nucleotidase CysQ n=1 Tax=Actibacterium sp. 188UL27-1 TaxID=2786961 RepID=UPI00195875A2|nr:3'(2'),5'-bisphosphate nucleotidase CysQ [Actibacterium sp. 188UL27-1]MBM7070148.1 3'(2'),5'-bisphosphate nucleotidase CysQ [Actibacterium sp. 188UL27-1]